LLVYLTMACHTPDEELWKNMVLTITIFRAKIKMGCQQAGRNDLEHKKKRR